MEMIRLNKYVLKNPNKQKLKSLGYKYNKYLSDQDEDFYSIKFPALKTEQGFTTLIGEIILNLSTKEVRTNLYQHDGTTYAPFYSTDLQDSYKQIIKDVNKSFFKILKESGIEKKG